MGKPIEQRGHRVGGTLGIDHQHDGDVQHPCYLGRRAAVAIVAVVEAHHALNDAYVGILTVVEEEFADVFGCGHKRVEVDAGPAAHRLMELRVDIVGAALKRLHRVALMHKQRHQPPGNSGLARAAGWRCYE